MTQRSTPVTAAESLAAALIAARPHVQEMSMRLPAASAADCAETLNQIDEALKDREIRTGAHLLQVAKSLGWPDDGEGALEFMLRRAREVAFEYCAAPPEQPAATEDYMCGYIDGKKWAKPATPAVGGEALGDCTQRELDAWIETIDSKNSRLLLMWRDRALKAEADLAAQPASPLRGRDAFEAFVKRAGFTDWSRYGDGYARPLIDRMWSAWSPPEQTAALRGITEEQLAQLVMNTQECGRGDRDENGKFRKMYCDDDSLSDYDGRSDVCQCKNTVKAILSAALPEQPAPLRGREALKKLIEKQANDEGCWFVAETITESYLQTQLRLLHAAYEGTDFFGFPLTGMLDQANYKIGKWLSAALEDPNVCAEMKADIGAWFEAQIPCTCGGDLNQLPEHHDISCPAALNQAAQPFTGCQLRGPGECQSRGMCLSDACKHTGKTIRPRYVAETREDGIKYPEVET